MQPLRPGFPKKLEGPMAWDGTTFEFKPELYTSTLSPKDLNHLKNAIEHFKALGISRGCITRDTFPLPSPLSELLGSVTDDINNGKGFHVVRGIDPALFSKEDHVVLFAGIAAYVASNRAALIDHICDGKIEGAGNDNLRPTELSVRMDFHTDADAGAILALFTEQTAQTGGEQYLSSFWHCYNIMSRDKPEVIDTLAEDWHWEKPGHKDPSLNQILPRRAIVGLADGKIQINYGRTFVAGHPKYPLTQAAPPLSKAQAEALQVLSETANRSSFKLDTQVGDILFVNNLSIMHARGAYSDNPDSGKVRHLLRLWLNDRDSWPFAPSLKYFNGPEFWNAPPDEQKLHTFDEWKQTPRYLRVTDTSNNHAHD
ncbi:unnamed protein product [Clonostachys rosea]|uniref:TauD/TfdA-like domain-containing protein n=1 Tax=Bionectria ochroleuca TaxID=29856 RepID=A0ABY6UHL9_BIOOC|nr:unnamed protein product [Clonostachys rosea]